MLESELNDSLSRMYGEWQEEVGFVPERRIIGVKIDFMGQKEDYQRPEREGVNYLADTEHPTADEYLLSIHESYVKVAKLLVSREIIRTFIPKAIEWNPIISYLIHVSISSGEYLWNRMTEQLREFFIDYIQQKTSVKVGLLRKHTAMSLNTAQMLRLLRDLRIDSEQAFVRILFWQTLFFPGGQESLGFEETVVFKQFLESFTLDLFVQPIKEIKDHVFANQRFIKVPKKLWEPAMADAIEKLDLRKCISINWAISNMRKYIALLELNPMILRERPQLIEYLFKGMRLVTTFCFSHHSVMIIFADSASLETSYAAFFGALKSKEIITDVRLYLVENYDNIINLNYFHHQVLPSNAILTESILKSTTFQTEYAQNLQYLAEEMRGSKKDKIQAMIEYLTFVQTQKDEKFPGIAFRKYLEQLTPADIAILFLCTSNRTTRPFAQYPVDKQSVEMLEELAKDAIRVIKRLETKKTQIEAVFAKYPSLRGASIELFLKGFEQIKSDIGSYIEQDLQQSSDSITINHLIQWLKSRSVYGELFIHEHADILVPFLEKVVKSSVKKESKEIAKRIDRSPDELLDPILKLMPQLRRIGFSIISPSIFQKASEFKAYFEKVAEDLKAYLGAEKEEFERKISDVFKYAGEMKAIDVNLFRSTLYSPHTFYVILNIDDSDSRIQLLQRTFFYVVKFKMTDLFPSMNRLKETSNFIYLKIQIPSALCSEIRARLYALFSLEELRFITDITGYHLFSSYSPRDLFVKLADPSIDYELSTEFASRKHEWMVPSDSNQRPPEYTQTQKEKYANIKQAIREHHLKQQKIHNLNEFFGSPFPHPEPKETIPIELIKFIQNPQTGLVAIDSIATHLKANCSTIRFIPSPNALRLQQILLILHSHDIDLYPDRICRTPLGILFGPGLHQLRYGSSGSENWLIIEYYLPHEFETISQGFKKVLDTISEYPMISAELCKVESQSIRYNFDLYLTSSWVNLDFALESRFRYTDRDFEILKAYMKKDPTQELGTDPLTNENIEVLKKFQIASFEDRIRTLSEIGSPINTAGLIDVDLRPENFDLNYGFAILVLCSDTKIAEKIKIICSVFPKSIQLDLIRLSGKSREKEEKKGVFVYVSCGLYSIRNTVFDLYAYLKKLGGESVEIFTGLVDPKLLEPSIEYFKQRSWSVWFSESLKPIPFFPLVGRYSYAFDSDDLMQCYQLSEQLKVFDASDYESKIRELRYALTELKKRGEKWTIKTISGTILNR